ncbi:hypothetical protein D3C78_1377230 [compost metagenome]
MTAEGEGVEQPVDLAARPHDRQRVRQVALDAAPGPDDVQVAHVRHEPVHLLQLLKEALRIEMRSAV